MEPKYWWTLSIVFVILSALTMDVVSKVKFDPESLPTPAAGTTAKTTQSQYTCDDFIFSVSEDGIKYVHESGGGIHLATESDHEILYFLLGEYGSLKNVDHTEIDSEMSEKLEFALKNCNAKYLPSGVNFAYR